MKTVYVMSKYILVTDDKYGPNDLIEERQLIRETPTAMRLVAGSSFPKGCLFSKDHYWFFESRQRALVHFADMANRTIAELEEKKRRAMIALCMANYEIQKEKGNAAGTA